MWEWDALAFRLSSRLSFAEIGQLGLCLRFDSIPNFMHFWNCFKTFHLVFVFVRRWSQIPVVFCDGGLKCRDLLEPEFIHKCRGLCLDADCSVDANNATSENNKTSDPLWSPHLKEPDINNETFNLLVPAAVPSTVGVANERRPDFYVEDTR